MGNFLNAGFLIGAAGVMITLTLSMLDYFRNKERSRVVLVLLLLGSIVVMAQAVLDELATQQNEKLDRVRSQLLEAIKGNVEHVRSVVDEINVRLTNVSLSDIGTELVTAAPGSEAAKGLKILTYGKANADQWRFYANWLASTHAAPDKASCLTLDLAGGHHYNVAMMLAYILTSQDTRAEIGRAMNTGAVYDFPSEKYLKKYGIRPKELDCVLFYRDKKVIAYANAKSFAAELFVYQRAKQAEKIEQFLNHGSPNLTDDLKVYFSSVQTDILESRNEIVRTMLKENVSQVTVMDQGRLYLVRLGRLVKLVDT